MPTALTPLRVHVLGGVSLNGGDAAIMAGQEAMLRAGFAPVTLSISDTHPDASARYMPQWSFFPFISAAARMPANGGRRAAISRRVLRRFWLSVATAAAHQSTRRIARTLAGARVGPLLDQMLTADAIGYTGGTSLVETYDLSDKLFDLEFAVRLGRPLVFLPQSAGPFENPEYRHRLREVMKRARVIVLRDERSLGHVLDLGIDSSRCHVRPDIAFALARPVESWPSVAVSPDPLRIAISVRAWSHFSGLTPEEGRRRFIDALRAVVDTLVLRRGAQVTFLSTCQGRPEYWTDDSEFAAEIARGLSPSVLAHVVVDRSARSTDELLTELAGFDAMLSTRLHGAILGVDVGVPVMAIAYEYKSREVWRQLGLEDWVVDIEAVESATLPEAFEAFLDARHDVRDQLASSVPERHSGALSVAELLQEALAPSR